MKNSSSIFALLLISLMLSTFSGFAFPGPSGSTEVPAMRAVKNFRKSFKDVVNETWSYKADGFRAKFVKDDVAYMVDYDKKGRWLFTFRSYNEPQLDRNIFSAVKTAYLDHNIFRVIEVHTQDTKMYFVKIEDFLTIKTIRIANGEMQEVESLVKK
jgi:hypothetical protein